MEKTKDSSLSLSLLIHPLRRELKPKHSGRAPARFLTFGWWGYLLQKVYKMHRNNRGRGKETSGVGGYLMARVTTSEWQKITLNTSPCPLQSTQLTRLSPFFSAQKKKFETSGIQKGPQGDKFSFQISRSFDKGHEIQPSFCPGKPFLTI